MLKFRFFLARFIKVRFSTLNFSYFNFNPISKAFIVNQNSVLYTRKLLNNRRQLFISKLIWIIHLKNIIQLSNSNIPIMIFIYLSNNSHYFFHFVVSSDHFYHFYRRDWSLMNLITVKFCFTKVAVWIHGFVNAFEVGYVHFGVHFVENYVVLLIVNSRDVDS